jgi:hypothetical protein
VLWHDSKIISFIRQSLSGDPKPSLRRRMQSCSALVAVP